MKRLEPGSTFAAPNPGPRFAVVRVLRICEEDSTSLVALTPWLEDHLPTLEDDRIRSILRQNRGFYENELAVSWYSGSPPEDFICLGKVLPTASELRIDAKGTYSGDWCRSMVKPVFLERGEPFSAVESPPSQKPAVAAMPDDAFWRVIAQLDRSGASRASVVAPAIEHLARMSEARIYEFQEALHRKLFALDREDLAHRLVEDPRDERTFSADHFLDVRCAVVARGRAFYERVLTDPQQFPDDDFEDLLTLAEQAIKRKTGKARSIDVPTDHSRS